MMVVLYQYTCTAPRIAAPPPPPPPHHGKHMRFPAFHGRSTRRQPNVDSFTAPNCRHTQLTKRKDAQLDDICYLCLFYKTLIFVKEC